MPWSRLGEHPPGAAGCQPPTMADLRKPEEDGYRSLLERARAVLDANWMGHATKPAPGLYPHQRSWDAAFIAIGYAHYDQERAQQELRSLFAGQWNNGPLPHIVFSPDATAYFPGPEFWQTERSRHAPVERATSGIVQPPNHATAASSRTRDAATSPAQLLASHCRPNRPSSRSRVSPTATSTARRIPKGCRCWRRRRTSTTLHPATADRRGHGHGNTRRR